MQSVNSPCANFSDDLKPVQNSILPMRYVVHLPAMGIGKGGPQGPGPPWFLEIAGQSRPWPGQFTEVIFAIIYI